MKERSRSPKSGTIVFAIISAHIWDEPNRKEMCRSGNGGCVRTVGLGVACQNFPLCYFITFSLIKQINLLSQMPTSAPCQTWVEGKNLPSISGMHLLPNIRHLESLNEPNDWILHASLKTLRNGEFRFLWIACELCGEADLGRKSVGKNERNALLRKGMRGSEKRLPSKSDERCCPGPSPLHLPQVPVRTIAPGSR